ncbi:FH2 domain-containing protein 1-like protein [Leptotrombidium deliense]|uniref:FH2 domain-containing protein 1-like protein n=1 Tax=Leptotrombidium deliense TaxID=299467 RepID=A0A443SDK7_9ACAR|nr:FH2 domain-containing protein 1-like protein [Leptotrombidium deliense]
MRTLNWTKIPVHKIVSTGRPNIWSLVCNNHECATSANKHFDFEALEDLFCQPNNAGSAPNSCPGSPRLSRRTINVGDSFSSPYNSLERKILMKFNGENQYQTEVNVLDGKKALNINIFLKQYRGSIDELLSRIREADHRFIGSERLRNLLKILPEKYESEALLNQKQNANRMPIAERFLLQLIEIDNYELKIEYMLLKDEFESNIACLQPSIDIINNAAQGYAGDAAGFKLTSLLKLSEIRANKPGISFIHFIAEEAEKKSLHNFIEELPNLEEALKISVESLKSEIDTISSKISKIKAHLKECSPESTFFRKINDFVNESEEQVSQLSNKAYYELENTRINLAEFLCEEPQKFKLEECFRILVLFSQRFKCASEENRKRKENELKMEARRMKNCDQLNLQARNECESDTQDHSISTAFTKVQKKSREKLTEDELNGDLFELLNNAGEMPGDNLFGSFRRVGSGRRSRPVSASFATSRERTFSDTNTENRHQKTDPTIRQSWTEESFSHRRKANAFFKETPQILMQSSDSNILANTGLLNEKAALNFPFEKKSHKSVYINEATNENRLNIQLNDVKNNFSMNIDDKETIEKETRKASLSSINTDESKLQEMSAFKDDVSQQASNVNNFVSHNPYRCAVISPTTVIRESNQEVQLHPNEQKSVALMRTKPATTAAISAIVRPLNVTERKCRNHTTQIKVSRSKLPVRDNCLTTMPQQRKQSSDAAETRNGSIHRTKITVRVSKVHNDKNKPTHAVNIKSANIRDNMTVASKSETTVRNSARTVNKVTPVTPTPRRTLTSVQRTKGFMRPTSSSNAKRF